jgi:hypothetical protein
MEKVIGVEEAELRNSTSDYQTTMKEEHAMMEQDPR